MANICKYRRKSISLKNYLPNMQDFHFDNFVFLVVFQHRDILQQGVMYDAPQVRHSCQQQ